MGYASFSRLLKLFHVEMKKVGESMRKEAVKKHNDEICSVCNGKKFVYEPAEYTCKEEPLPDTVFLLLTDLTLLFFVEKIFLINIVYFFSFQYL